jgi:hypothetical protein
LADQFKDKRRTVHIGSCKLMCGDLKAASEREAAAIKVWIVLYSSLIVEVFI